MKDEIVDVPLTNVQTSGFLFVPDDTLGVVAFAHGSGSGRLSPRNQYVAGVLNESGIATLLLDLLLPEEETDRSNVFDIPLLGDRLSAATKWLRLQPEVAGIPIGYFGASTGAGAALRAAAEPENKITAVVSRGGRPDLAKDALARVTAPTLLIVGGNDETVLRLNQDAQRELHAPSKLEIVPGATHLFEEAGALEVVAGLARDWFVEHFA